MYGGALEIEQNHRWDNDVGLTANLRYNYLVDDSYRASDPELEGRNDFSVMTAAAELNGPTDLALFGGRCAGSVLSPAPICRRSKTTSVLTTLWRSAAVSKLSTAALFPVSTA
ncbi:Uncharacterised protein [Serratia rubidaea]|uniref:Uncharacterized protein n=1 Tax=Serratia rubidaea TaxID=61652 RepID=A0A4U9HKL0_SERRU|nr:Uncharacterised protein [Serratia rubidaea]